MSKKIENTKCIHNNIIKSEEKNISYKLDMINVTNTFTNANNLYYTIKRNGSIISNDNRTPYSDTTILNDVTIPAKSEHVYIIEYEFKDTGVNQDVDQNKIFRTGVRVAIAK